MTSRKTRPGRTPPRPWVPMRPATRIVPPELAGLAEKDPEVAARLEETAEMWRNDRYVVTVHRRPEGSVSTLSIRRDDRKAARDWRDFQQIKNDIAGPDAEAVELYPAEDRLVDTANQFWLWCLPPGTRFPFGFPGRAVEDTPDPRFPRSQQRALGGEG